MAIQMTRKRLYQLCSSGGSGDNGGGTNSPQVLDRFVTSDHLVKSAYWKLEGPRSLGVPRYSPLEIEAVIWEVRLASESTWTLKSTWAEVRAYAAARSVAEHWYLRGTVSAKQGLENIEIGLAIELL
ncbi:hypothetical protein AAG747_07920 [Rapidithrix thailandica]|uniref:Uncharacterized protein n=1 Tax=Rapidithrix thailandica TaxID=413964 RepID=A0AAW9S417_9BACT